VILLLIFTSAYYVAAKFGFAAAKQTAAGLRIPLAPSLAGALFAALAVGLIPPAAEVPCKQVRRRCRDT
jgi:hypothetical protein